MPRHTLFHCVMFALAFSHFISSPTARTVTNDFVDYTLVSKITIQLKTKDTMPGPASSLHLAFRTDRPSAPVNTDVRWYAAEHFFLVSPLLNQLSTERLLL